MLRFGVYVILNISRTTPLPLYEYECRKCHTRTERIEKLKGPHLKVCPKCKGPVDRVLSAPAIQFKGSGWYVTDYARSSSAASGESGKSDAAPAAAEKGAAADGKSKEKPASKGKKANAEK
jgi:putative FmdB family regulatory protein